MSDEKTGEVLFLRSDGAIVKATSYIESNGVAYTVDEVIQEPQKVEKPLDLPVGDA